MDCCCSLYYLKILLIFLSLTLFLIKINLHRFSNSNKVLLFKFALFFIAFGFWPFMLFRPKDYRNLLIPFTVLRISGEFLGFTVEIRGKENIKQNHGAVIIVNHQSSLDLLLLSYIYPLLGRAKIVAKKALLYYPFFGAMLWLSGFLFIDRKKHNKAYSKLDVEIIAIRDQNYKLLMFPEGTRSLTETFKPFKKGAFHTAIKSQCPIQPIVFSHYHFLRSNRPATRRNHMIISILPEVPTNIEFKTENNIDILVDRCRNQMQKEYTKITAEINKNKSQ